MSRRPRLVISQPLTAGAREPDTDPEMTTPEYVAFLQTVLPRLGLRWIGFRKVRRLVCKRISKRIAELDLADLAAYRGYLEQHDSEWHKLEEMCRIPISRFYLIEECVESRPFQVAQTSTHALTLRIAGTRDDDCAALWDRTYLAVRANLDAQDLSNVSIQRDARPVAVSAQSGKLQRVMARP